MIQCPSCQAENPNGTAFCEDCGASLSQMGVAGAAVAPIAQPQQPAEAPTGAASPSGKECPSCQTENPLTCRAGSYRLRFDLCQL